MRATRESTSRPAIVKPFHPSAASATAGAAAASPPAPSRPPARPTSRTPRANAFSVAFLFAARRLERPEEGSAAGAFASGGLDAGPFHVEPLEVRHGRAWAVVRRGESVTEGDRAVGVFRDRTAALLVAAVLPAAATPCHLHVAETAKPLGRPVHDGRAHLGHLSPTGAAAHGHLPRDLHVARFLATHPDSLVLLAEALDYETLVLLGRALMRRMDGAA